MKNATPHYEKISHATTRKDCITSYEMEKRKLMAELKQVNRVSVTTDLWRWNATYFMLSTSLEFKDVFPRYQQRDPTYNSLPSDEDWEKVLVVCSFLEEFKEVTHVISGMEKIGSTNPSRLRKQRCARGRATSRAAARTYMQDEK
ncbi:zinc finger BED domain-containing protein RICESLEEPER 4-like isoform X2 [Primulina eburnea]